MEKNTYKILQANACNKNLLKKDSIDLIITSPPYNIGKDYSSEKLDSISYDDYLVFTRNWIFNCYYWAKSSGRICINIAIDKNKYGKNPLYSDITQIAMQCGWKYHTTIIWNKGNISKRTAWGSWKSASAPHIISPVETIVVFYKDVWKKKELGPNDITADEFKDWVLGVWSFRGENGKRIGHAAPFPREIPKRCIKLFSFVGNQVLDPFLGSGTTIIEAIENKRNAIGIELEEQYCLLSLERINKECKVKLKTSQVGKAEKSITLCRVL